MLLSTTPLTLDQALFTSTRSAKNEGYQIACRSAGIDDATARELTAWAPSHDSLQDGLPEVESLNAHLLSDGRWCLSLTRFASDEYSGRGRNVATWLLLAETAAMEMFGFHPLRMIDAAMAAGWGRTPAADTEPLAEITLAGRGRLVNLEAVALVCARYGANAVAQAVDAVEQSQHVAIAVEGCRRVLIDAILSLIPARDRPAISFTTGLTTSLRRPFRLHLLSRAEEGLRTFHRTFSGDIVDLFPSSDSKTLLSERTRQLAELLAAERWCELRRQVM
jgi:hypothetical protein